MRCEICDKYINSGKRVMVEGSVVVTCDDCCGYGKVLGEAKTFEPRKETAMGSGNLGGSSQGNSQGNSQGAPLALIDFEIETRTDELVEDYSGVIRKAREKTGMKQKDLAQSINEPVSLIHRIESNKLKPRPQVIRKLQNKLGIILFDRSGGQKTGQTGTVVPKELTLGDMVVVRRKKK